jgi:hypothetical protein
VREVSFVVLVICCVVPGNDWHCVHFGVVVGFWTCNFMALDNLSLS